MSIKGIAYPFSKGNDGIPSTADDATLIEESLRSIILTPVGQRVMRPTFGCNAMMYVFESNDILLQAKVRQETARAIRLHEPRVTVRGIVVTSDDNKVYVEVGYTVNRTQGVVTVELPKAGV